MYFTQFRMHPSAFYNTPNSNITVQLWVNLYRWVTREDSNFISGTITNRKIVICRQGLSMTILYPVRGPSSPLKGLFFLQAVISQYDTQATANEPCLLPWISLSGSSKVQLLHEEKVVGSQAWWSSWQTERPCQRGLGPTVPEQVTRGSPVTVVSLGWESRSPDKTIETKQDWDQVMESSQWLRVRVWINSVYGQEWA